MKTKTGREKTVKSGREKRFLPVKKIKNMAKNGFHAQNDFHAQKKKHWGGGYKNRCLGGWGG